MFVAKNQVYLKKFLRDSDKKIVFVPTMGALHAGHISLVEEAKKRGDIVVVSIFVNPTQFDNKDDLVKYPRPIIKDIEKLCDAGCDVLYMPSVEDIYPTGTQNLKKYDLGYLDEILEGEYRDGHYQGVANVVYRLLQAVNPDVLILGAKDYQQIMVIEKMLNDEDINLEIVKAPIIREENGLARSSRNERLSPDDREKAAVIYENLQKFMSPENRKKGMKSMREEMAEELTNAGFGPIDYIALADADNLKLLEDFDEELPMIVLVAAYLGDVRLIDNQVIN